MAIKPPIVTSLTKLVQQANELKIPSSYDAIFIAQWKAKAGATWGFNATEAQLYTYMALDKQKQITDWTVRLTAEGVCVAIKRQIDCEDIFALTTSEKIAAIAVKRKDKPLYVGIVYTQDCTETELKAFVDSIPKPFIAQKLFIDFRALRGNDGKTTWNLYLEQMLFARAKAVVGKIAYPGLIGCSAEENL